ncbi:MAG: WG repeat-containing protein, partial [Muribaculaceae bacterium]|nr:WG repeat-containing protein [Muribaculaceae bacterium]
ILGTAISLCPTTVEAQSFLKKASEKLKKVQETVSSVTQTTKKPAKKGNTKIVLDEENEVEEIVESVSKSVDLPLHPELIQGDLYQAYADKEVNKKFMPRVTPATVELELKKHGLYYSDFSDGVALIYEPGKAQYFINTIGEKLPIEFEIPRNFDDNAALPKFYNGRTLLKQGGRWKIVDKQGNVIKTLPEDVKLASGFVNGIGILISVPAFNKWKIQFIDTNGNVTYPTLGSTGHTPGDFTLSKMFRPTVDGLTAVQRFDPATDKLRWGFYDKTGKMKIPAKYYKVHDFSDGLAAVQEMKGGQYPTGGKWGFIDTNGNVVIDFQYDREPSDFNGDYAVVGKTYYEDDVIDRTGKVINKVKSNDQFVPVHDGYAICSTVENGKAVQYVVKGLNFEPVAYSVGTKIDYPEYDPVDGKYYQERCTFRDPFGWIDLPNMTTKVMNLKGYYRNGIAKAVDGYVNEEGQYIIKFKYVD